MKFEIYQPFASRKILTLLYGIKKVKLTIQGVGPSGRKRSRKVPISQSVSGLANSTSTLHQSGDVYIEEAVGTDSLAGHEEKKALQRQLKPKKTCQQIKQVDVDRWRSLRNDLLETATSLHVPPKELMFCLSCLEKNSFERSAIHKCKDCDPCYYVCFDCLVHEHILTKSYS